MDDLTLLSVAPTATGLVVSGELDLATAGQLADHLDPLPGHGAEVRVDLSGLTFLDSSGLRVLIEAHQRAEVAGRTIVFTGVSIVVRRILELAGVADYLVLG